ncbi:RagB/SusD family nutrient uptake outer membrane protein [Chitinophaga barathri]|uniref:RagB/SusD family nutrient uptake outer membrane protein n=2 Tax=Chitinophaga barathri TaxID=1647451 RepID=A0A3N4MSX2_9BACT|nr:RagB/SusD family nutrient uptake outer membrane protein [Chitinophaga barathri]
MKIMQKKYIIWGLAGLLTGAASCTNLDEKVYSEIPADNFYKNRTEVMAAVLRPFTHANAWAAPTGQVGYWRVSELSADQLAWPTKGRHGFDNGDWIRLHRHTWIANDNNTWNPWRLMYWGLGFCNNTIKDLSAIDFKTIGMTDEEKASIIAETKVLRAWHYLKLMDLYGNIPIVTEVGIPTSPPNAPRAEVWAFIEKELRENVDLLPKLQPSLVGRVTRAGGYAMLAELYLNAQVWAGTPKWDECVAACNKILDGSCGSLSGAAPALETDMMKPFATNNATSPENLFQIAYDYTVGNFRFGFQGDLWHYVQGEAYNSAFRGNNGIVVIPTAYDAFAANDLRRTNWLLIGELKKHPALRKTVADSLVMGTEEYNGKPLIFVKEIRKNSTGQTGEGTMMDGEENSGARFNKYQTDQQTNTAQYCNNDFVLYRLAEIYYNKAEALMRKNGNVATQEAVDLVNEVRKRAFSATDWVTASYTIPELTLDEFLAERGREFIFEGKRRADLIRFGKFTTATWWDHTPTAAKYNVFPIPYQQMVLNKNLKQNEGYDQ